MTVAEVMVQLEALGQERTRAHNKKFGASDNQFGVAKGALRKLAKQIKHNQDLGLALWETGNVDARLLAILLVKPKKLSPEQVDQLVRSVSFSHVADWLNAYVVKKHPANEPLRQTWMNDSHPMAARAGWSLTSERVVKDAEGLDLPGLLDRVEAEMGSAAPPAQWTMNSALVNIGVHFPEHRARALAIGEALGVYSDWPTVKGCTSPFAPTWINEMVSRQSG